MPPRRTMPELKQVKAGHARGNARVLSDKFFGIVHFRHDISKKVFLCHEPLPESVLLFSHHNANLDSAPLHLGRVLRSNLTTYEQCQPRFRSASSRSRASLESHHVRAMLNLDSAYAPSRSRASPSSHYIRAMLNLDSAYAPSRSRASHYKITKTQPVASKLAHVCVFIILHCSIIPRTSGLHM